MRRAGLTVHLLALLAVQPLWAQDAPLRPVVTEILRPEPVMPGRYTGEIEASVTVGVAFELLGRLTERPATEGEAVREGQELARIDARALQDDRDAALSQVESLEVTLATVERARKRAIELGGRGVASTAVVETAERNETVARANLEQARATLARAEDALSRTVLRAPMDGIVIQTRHEPGTTIAAGDPVLVLASHEGRNAVLTLPVAMVAEAKPGQPFVIHSPKLPPEGIAGELLRIDPASVSATRMRLTRIALPPEAKRLAIGELVSVTPLADDNSRITLPVQALMESGGTLYVWQVSTSPRVAVKTPVNVAGEALRGRVPVTGLSAGMEIITRGVNGFEEGAPVGPALSAVAASAALPLIAKEN